MRLAFVSDNSYPWFNGGIEKRRYIIMRRLAREGNDIHCFTMHRKGMPGWEFAYRGIRYHCVGEALDWRGMYRGGSRRRSIRMPVLFSLQLLWKIMPYRFEAVDADEFPFLHLFPLWLYSKLRGVRFAITWHEVWSKEFWKGYLHGLGVIGYYVQWLSSRMADIHISNASTTKRLLEQELGVRSELVINFPVAVDGEEMRRYANRRYRKKDQFIVVSRLVGHKRVWLAIDAVAQTEAKLLIVGAGPDLEKLQETAREKAPGRVVFRHSLTTEQLYRSMLESRAMIMPSAREGLSLVTIEALSLGVPVVVANTSALPEEVKRMCVQTSEKGLGLMLNKILRSGAAYERASALLRSRVLSEFSAESAGRVYGRVAGR
ncbi:MAG: glycosyltransferase family 4 protein [Candidatus Micrarchaeota archaeon]|nr:glycosyltransferase family 4 protein [Candidatus Micrarchaeota archaeon]